MSVLIAHASIDERGKASGGQAGDQSGKEVCVRSWYNGGWNVVLRPKSAAVAEKMAVFAEQICRGNYVGYDQWERNTLRDVAKAAGWDGSKVKTKCETDCSAFMTVCAEAAGVNMSGAYVKLGNNAYNAPVTQTMRGAFSKTGAFTVLTDQKYLTGDQYLKRGDVLVRESGHTAMVVTNGEKAGVNTASAGGAGIVEKTYTIKSGDTLWDIAQQYGITVQALMGANGMKENTMIYPGKVLKIPG